MKIVYSLKKDECFLVDKNNQLIDFAGNTWDRKNKFFKAIFGPVVMVAKIKPKKEKENVENQK